MSFEEDIKERFKGYHVEIMFYPSGGMIECTGCEECNTDDSRFDAVSWKTEKGATLESAIKKLEDRMSASYGENWKAD